MFNRELGSSLQTFYEVAKKEIKEEKREDVVDPKTDKPSTGTPVKIDKTAFAKFKTYNNATKKSGISSENDKTINRFLHLGASRNWTPILKKVKHNPINGFNTDLIPNSNNKNKMSYLDYKNSIQKKDL